MCGDCTGAHPGAPRRFRGALSSPRAMTSLDPATTLRRLLMAILLLGLSGSATELVLLRHHEDWKQSIPLGLIVAALAVLTWHGLGAGAASVRALRFLMTLLVLAGLLGVALHFQSTLEFQREIDPSLRGWRLVLKALQAKAPPALAPGVLVQLGLLGLALTYRHPALAAARVADTEEWRKK